MKGKIWPQDRQGHVLNIAKPFDALNPDIKLASITVAKLCIEKFGEDLHSVYLSGPAARNFHQRTEFIVILRIHMDAAKAQSWAVAVAREIAKRFKYLPEVRFKVKNWRDIFPVNGRFSKLRFDLAVNSICVGGRDVCTFHYPQALTAAVANADIFHMKSQLAFAVKKLQCMKDGISVKRICSQAGEIMLKCGFALILEREQIYSQDLDVMRDFIMLNYPEQTAVVQLIYDMAITPPTQTIYGLNVIQRVLPWLGSLCDSWLDDYNPTRETVLRASYS